MAKQLQLRRGTTAEHSTFTGAVGEITIDTDKDVVVVHDGSTVGGKPTQTALVSGTNIKTVNGVSLLGSGDVGNMPTGCIVLWSGAVASIPSGWALCNGANGTPNLQDRFIVGAGSSYAVGATGGATSASVSGTTGATTLTVDQMPSHTHNASGYDTGSNISSLVSTTNGRYRSYYATTAAGSSGSHTHSMSGTVDTRSPYYALAYIMKL